jgi:hypothetical protein
MCDTEVSMHGMLGSRSSLAAFTVTALALVLVPTAATASLHSEDVPHTARADGAHACLKPAVEVIAGAEAGTFSLEKCDGEAVPASVDKLSILARPTSVPRPKEPLAAGRTHGAEIAPGVRRLDSRLAERLELVADHFRKEGQATRIVLASSGSKARRTGSYHGSGRAIDFRIDGVDNDALVAFCKTLEDTGCGYYPNEGFVHLDVRDAGAGHVAWIDVSRQGDPPKYVSAWPPPAEPAKEADSTTESALAPLPAAAQVAPMERAEQPDRPAPPHKKHRKHHHKRATTDERTL